MNTEMLDYDWNQFVPYRLVGIEIYNFKSYQNKHLIGPLTDLTSIIGPNGSGKSNLMDAINFALDTKIYKWKNITKFSDSNEFMFYVKLIFKSKNSEKKLTIQRSFKKEIQYFINGSNVSKSDYIDGLNKLGFNIKNKMFLVFQDTVEKMIVRNPKDFSMILEEFSGSYIYKDEYDTLKKKISQKENELFILVNEKQKFFKSKKFIEFLNSESKKNDSILKDIDEIKTKQVLLDLYYNQYEIKKSKEIIEKSICSTEKEVDQLEILQNNKNKISQEIVKIKEEKNKLENNIRETEINVMLKNKCQYQLANDQCNQIENRLKNANINKNKLLFEQKINQNVIQSLQQEIQKLKVEIETYKVLDKKKYLDEETISEYRKLKNLFLTEIASFGHDNFKTQNKINNLEQEKKLIQINKTELEKELKERLNDDVKLVDIVIKRKEYVNNLNELKEKSNKLNQKLDNIKNDIIQYKKEIDSLDETLINKYVHMNMDEKTGKQQQFIQYLKDNYPGVRGRLGDLCKPKNKQYQLAISVLMKKYLKAIVVDSFKTIELIFKNEKNQFINSEIFLSLDMIKAPTLKENLRYIKIPEVHLVYDLIEYEQYLEKVIRFVVGNTLLCDTREKASQIAYNLNEQYNYNVISLDGTLFSAKGHISKNLTKKFKIPWTNDTYLEYVLKKKAQQKQYLQILKEKDTIVQNINQIDVQLFECNTEIENLLKIENDYEKRTQQKKTKNEMQEQLKDLDEQLNVINLELEECTKSFSKYQQHLDNTERTIFGSLLSKFNFSNIKQFELMYFNLIDEKHLDECEDRLKNLLTKLEIENKKEIVKEIEKWERILQDESKLLDETRKTMTFHKKKLEEDNKSFSDLQISLGEYNNELKQKTIELKEIQTMLEKHQKNLESYNKSLLKSKSDLKILYNKRHELLKRSNNEAITLPFLSDPTILQNINDLDINEIYDKEENILLNFDKFPEIKITNNDEYREMKLKLENEQMKKEEEIQQLTLVLSSSLSTKKNELSKNIQSINKNISKLRNELDELETQFEQVKQKRCNLFNTFLEKVSSNVSSLYKELMQNEISQSYLIPENPEEPYLEGLLYNCIVPGKIFQPISCLSGGEKTLAIFVFILALYWEKMPPFFIMDEIDAALDPENTFKLVKFLKSKSALTQFILISLKPELFGQTNSLIGVCKEKNENNIFTSKTLSLDIGEYLD